MEDWQQHSLEEKVDLENLVIYSEDNINIENSDHTKIKKEAIEPDKMEGVSVKFSTNRNEICQICGLDFESKTVLKIHNSLIHPGDEERTLDEYVLKDPLIEIKKNRNQV